MGRGDALAVFKGQRAVGRAAQVSDAAGVEHDDAVANVHEGLMGVTEERHMRAALQRLERAGLPYVSMLRLDLTPSVCPWQSMTAFSLIIIRRTAAS